MKADPHGVLTGTHFIDGDHACCEGALAAGARFAAGYPITPSTEVVERFAARMPTVGGSFIQMEDELAASIALQGAVWGGAKAFTVTSGPGFSLKQLDRRYILLPIAVKHLDGARHIGRAAASGVNRSQQATAQTLEQLVARHLRRRRRKQAPSGPEVLLQKAGQDEQHSG